MANEITLFRGVSLSEIGVDVGSCWTPDCRSAESYGEELREMTLDLDTVTVLEAPAYDRDEDFAPGDTAADRAKWAALGADWIVYADEDCEGQLMTTYRKV